MQIFKLIKPVCVRSVFIFVLFTMAALFFGCGNTKPKVEPQSKPAVDIKKQREDIKSTLIEMWDAIEKGDIDRYATFIHPDFTQFGETAKVLRVGKKAEVKGIKDWVEEPTTVHTEMKDPRITINGDIAWITYYWSDKGVSKGKPFATKGKSTRIFVNEKGKWLCIHGHYTLLEDDESES